MSRLQEFRLVVCCRGYTIAEFITEVDPFDTATLRGLLQDAIHRAGMPKDAVDSGDFRLDVYRCDDPTHRVVTYTNLRLDGGKGV